MLASTALVTRSVDSDVTVAAADVNHQLIVVVQRVRLPHRRRGGGVQVSAHLLNTWRPLPACRLACNERRQLSVDRASTPSLSHSSVESSMNFCGDLQIMNNYE